MIRFFQKILSRPKNDGIFSTKIYQITKLKPVNISLYEEAFTHRSIKHKKNYERLEFLGDAILGAIIANWLYHQLPKEQEGNLTQMRSKIVSRKKLNYLGGQLKLNHFIRSKANLGNDILGDVFEALVGAIYEDHGYLACEKFILNEVIKKYINLEQLKNKISSYKSVLIEWSQKNKKNILFETKEEINAQKELIFSTSLKIDNKIIAKGRATSKKKAEEIASKRTYFSIQKII